MGTRTYIAEIEDPITGETTVLEADTPQALDTLVEEHLSLMAPADQENPGAVTGSSTSPETSCPDTGQHHYREGPGRRDL